MSQADDAIERGVLSAAFQDAMSGSRLLAAVFLTFRFDPGFFEQEILPVFFDIPMSHAPTARVLHLEDLLRSTGPVAVYYDRRALVPGTTARTDFQRIGVTHRTGYFHPKNVFLLVENEGDDEPKTTNLIVASLSANLTRAGWWRNVEVAHIERAELGEPCGFRDDLLSMISLLRRVSPAGSDHAALDEIHSFVRKLGQETQRRSGGLLLTRMYTGNRDLTEFIDEIAGRRLRERCLEIISPYFDDKESIAPLKGLIDRFRPTEVRVFLPRGLNGEALCSEEYWEAIHEADAIWGKLPPEVVRLTRQVDRDVHAKVYRFFDPADRRETFFVGSVNLTNAGFGHAGNVESGFLVEQESPRRCDWWLQADDRRPAAFVERGEGDNLSVGPGINLVLRFDWSTGTATAFWDAAGDSPSLGLSGAGVSLGTIPLLAARTTTILNNALADRLRDHLRSSSFVTVSVEGESDAIVLVDESGSHDKPSLLTTLSPEEILRFWSSLTDEQKQQFFEEHAAELSDDELQAWGIDRIVRPPDRSVFATFAHVYLSFGNLERAVRKALDQGRRKEAIDRLFGQKFDSLRRLVERIAEREQPDPVRDYVTLLCGLQLLNVLRAEEPDFYRAEQKRFELVNDINVLLEQRRGQFTFADDEERARFFGWFERWFVRRAQPPAEVTAE